ncbi:AMP-binding protein [Pseudovibrio sp. SPO723]|uniref:AMP-binding protein n=1 Tax=Nesiotobacter zosterae TaxID=392721 RepID=UPI0029C54ABA|nr:AMP-binding protein [Pseudovibrio sp. SPO723]MDX5593492.1 AMP-binding protein [Pseudovibrio sp. SPO723]
MVCETLSQGFLEEFQKVREAVALHTDEGEVRYLDLLELHGAFCHQVENLPLPSGSRVALFAEKSARSLALILALWHHGHPVMIVPAGLGDKACDKVFEDAAIFAQIGVDAHGTIEILKEVRGKGFTKSTDNCALILTTSGSTGVPKGVMLPANALKSFFAWAKQQFSLVQNSKVFSYAPLNFDLALLEIWTPLSIGACSVLADPAKGADGAYLRALVSKHEPELIEGVPLLYRMLAETDGSAALKAPFVKNVIMTGEKFSKEQRLQLAHMFPEAIFRNVYGATETNDSLIFSCNAEELTDLEMMPVGMPLPHVKILVEPTDEPESDDIARGELLVSTPFQATGYTDPVKTEDAFLTRVVEGVAQTFYKTGDLVRMKKNGLIYLEGRSDFIVKVRGVRTNIVDVEIALTSHPDVEAAAVIPLPDAAAGTKLAAVVQVSPGAKLNSLTLRSYCAEHIPRSAIPSLYKITSDPLARTSTGKPDRKSLAGFFQEAGETTS